MKFQKTPELELHPQAVLFDFDGVIAPPTVNLVAWKSALESLFGVKMQDSDWYRHEGRSPEFIAQALIEQYSLEGKTAKEISEAKAKIANDLIEKISVEPYFFVKEILSFLKNKNIKIAVVTGSTRQRLQASIPELFPLFDVTVTVDDQIEGRKIREKPDPEPFLIAAQKLSLLPSDCWVIENAPLGIESAKKAGCYCLAITTTMDSKKLAGADEVLESHKELLNRLKITFND